MKTKIFLSVIFFILSFSKSISKEIEFEASNMDIKNEGKIIYAFNSKTFIPSDNIIIYSDKVEYNKQLKEILFFKNVNFYDRNNNIIIKSDEVKYDIENNIIYTYKDTFFNIDNKYDIETKNVVYDRNISLITTKNKTQVNDEKNNIYIFDKNFFLNLKKEIIKSKKTNVIDNQNNKYFFEDSIVDLKNNQIAGNEVKIEFEKSYFGNEDNEPILKGRSTYTDEKDLKIYKAVFSTCNTKNKKCRGWELNSNEFNHDKEKKIFEYTNSWLKIFNYRVFYLPYFNHPDPTVKRKSGFLTPSYSTSDVLGTSIKFPYFKVISRDKDMTFNPRYYADKSFLLQNEYRQALKYSNILSDFSFLIGEEGTNSHLFYNQVGIFNSKASYELNLQKVKGDNYLKRHNLLYSSPLINDEKLLLSNLDINWKFDKSNLYTSFKVYEDLSRNYSDRYQYIFPEFDFSKNISLPENYNGSFDFNSYGSNKNYDTNIFESSITNDFLYSSNDFINDKGFLNNYYLLLKNTNSYSNNSSDLNDNENYDLYGTFKYDLSLPLKKLGENYTNYLKPKLSFRYSPNGNTDLTSNDLLLNFDNVFSLNRIGTSSQVEGGEALSIGLEYLKENNNMEKILEFRLANVLKLEKNTKFPLKSKLNETRSDIFGDLTYVLNKNLEIGYAFSYDRDLEYSNLEAINTNFNLNNFYTNFYYYTQRNDFGNSENISNDTTYKLNNENRLTFSTSKDLNDDFTRFYNLVYEYKTDCISINFNYNKTFYKDGNLEPNKSLSFLIKIIPFTEYGVTNIENIVGN